MSLLQRQGVGIRSTLSKLQALTKTGIQACTCLLGYLPMSAFKSRPSLTNGSGTFARSARTTHMAADVMMTCCFVNMLSLVQQHLAGCTRALPASWQQPQNGCLQNIFHSPFCSCMSSTSLALCMTRRLQLDCIHPGIP